MKAKQTSLLKKISSAYGSDLMKKRKGRIGPRPISIRHTMHFVLRSSQAKGEMSFRTSKNSKAIDRIIAKFSSKYGVHINKFANVGNHLHLWVKIGNRHTYKQFICAVTSAIAMAVTGVSRWKKGNGVKFWDRRPFSRIIDGGFRAVQTISDYLRLNQLEGQGYKRDVARIVIRDELRVSSA